MTAVSPAPEVSNETRLALVQQDVAYIRGEITEMKSGYMSKLEGDALSKRVKLLESIVFGLIGIIVVAVIGSVVGLVIKK